MLFSVINFPEFNAYFPPYSGLGTNKPLVATAAMPSTSMKIYRGESVDGRVAESVKIGDPLTMVISIGKFKKMKILEHSLEILGSFCHFGQSRIVWQMSRIFRVSRDARLFGSGLARLCETCETLIFY